VGTTDERRVPQAELPPFWKGRLEDVEAAAAAVRHGTSQVIARSPGGRPVYRVAYGPRIDLQQQANCNSAVGAGDPRFYARKLEGAPPVVLLIGPPRGQEMEGNEPLYTHVTHDQILDLELLLFEELLAFAVETPLPGREEAGGRP
jgi:hypothetical protein